MNIRIRKIIAYRLIAIASLLVSVGLSSYALAVVIMAKASNLILNCIALGLTIAFAIAQIILISSGKKKESKLIDIAFNNDYTVNKLGLVIVLVGTTIGVALDVLSIIVLCVRENTATVTCSMFIIMAISSYLILNCLIYFVFLILFRKKELTLEDYAK